MNFNPFNRRQFLNRFGMGLGGIALADLLSPAGQAAMAVDHGVLGQPHFPPKAKRIIYLFMSGGPSQLDLFDYKPKLTELNMLPCPPELLKGQTFAFIKGTPKILGSPFKFAQYGQSGGWVSETLPHFSKIVDDVAVVRSMWTVLPSTRPVMFRGSVQASLPFGPSALTAPSPVMLSFTFAGSSMIFLPIRDIANS